MFLKVKGGGGGGGSSIVPVQCWGSTCRFGARSECGQRVRSINRIAPQGSHRYSRREHDTIVLHRERERERERVGGGGGGAHSWGNCLASVLHNTIRYVMVSIWSNVLSE